MLVPGLEALGGMALPQVAMAMAMAPEVQASSPFLEAMAFLLALGELA